MPSKNQVDKAGGIMRAWFSEGRLVGEAERAALEVLWEHRAGFAYPMTKVSSNLRYYVHRENHGIVVVAQRHKRMPRIIEKLHRQPRMRMSQMQDVAGCRAVLSGQDIAYRVLEGITKNWEIAAIDDYVGNPRNTGYRALHLVALRDGLPVEVQLRTHGQQTWADEVERLDGMTNSRLKDGEGPDDAIEYTHNLADFIAAIERGETIDTKRGAHLRNLREAAIKSLLD